MKDIVALLFAGGIALFGGYMMGSKAVRAECNLSFDRLQANSFLEDMHYHEDGSKHLIRWDYIQTLACDGEGE